MDAVPFRNKYILQSYNTGPSAQSSVGDPDPGHCLASVASASQPPVHQPFTPERQQQQRFRPCGRSHDSNQNYNQYKKSKAAANKENMQRIVEAEATGLNSVGRVRGCGKDGGPQKKGMIGEVEGKVEREVELAVAGCSQEHAQHAGPGRRVDLSPGSRVL